MVDRLDELGDLEQEVAADEIAERFGREYIYINDNGNAAIEQEILDAFRKLTEGEVVWDRSEFLWRYRQEYDPAATRAVT